MATYRPFSDVVDAYGYRQPPPLKPRTTTVALAFAYMIIGGALGTVAGTGLAIATLNSSRPAAAFQVASPVEASSTAHSSVAASSQQAPAPGGAASFVPASAEMSSSAKTVTPGPAASHHPRHVHHLNITLASTVPEGTASADASASTAPAAMPVITPAVLTQTKNYTFFSEGDATVADFDASAGRIETYEGRTFVIGATEAAATAASWQDSGSNVHYRCDQSGNCTLMRPGLIMQNVRLL